ncbi:DUF3016 domain-containing protein [Pseudidiomarina taiwanensis]|uniref:DUF3016 domain-containing protein n=1 Tax=Pseudidiomarina taiwanensis TaxID=337250 RepID=A0A432ZFZ7_9GAMM|nr:DUF3016 domain-containing protein [Pseudidiomarina taiwanensis]RUO76853.1 DUF3016 domain-containing protein [Pseudidiomarina taiwanensis]
MMNVASKSIILLAGLLSFPALAATTQVTFKDPESYRDIEAVNELQSRFEEKIFTGLREHFTALGELLPESNQLNITVTELDITGRVEPTFGVGGAQAMRVVDRIDFPRIHFSYTYTDASGQVVKTEEVKLNDVGFEQGMRRALRSGRDQLYYEKKLLDEWFYKSFGIRPNIR